MSTNDKRKSVDFVNQCNIKKRKQAHINNYFSQTDIINNFSSETHDESTQKEDVYDRALKKRLLRFQEEPNEDEVSLNAL